MLNVELGAGHIPHHRVVLNDVSHFVDLARSAHAGGKLFLLAGCWGAKAGVTFAAQQGHRPLAVPAMPAAAGTALPTIRSSLPAMSTPYRRVIT